MSKRLISEEWSDDNIQDNEGLVQSQSKKYKGRQRFINNKSSEESDESSKSANNFLKSLVNSLSSGLTNIMNNSYKFFTSKPNNNESYESVRNETQLRTRGMNSIAIVTNNPDILCCGINIDKAKHLLNLAQSRSANTGSGEQRFEQIIRLANSMKSPKSLSQYKSPAATVIQIDDDDQQIIDLKDEINCSAPKTQPNGLKSIGFNFSPIDILFGTYKCDVKEVVFTLRSIKLIDIPVNTNASNVEFLRELIIEFNEISKILYITQDSKISILIIIVKSD
jgi:hypothetical protein